MHRSLKRFYARGFTIVELVVVVVVVGILAGLAVMGYNGIQAEARDKILLSDVESIEAEVTRYATRNGGEYTAVLNWDSTTGPNSAINFTPSDGNIIRVYAAGDNYCIKAYNARSNSQTIANAVSKGTCELKWKTPVVAPNSLNSCAIASNYSAYCWGFGGYNQNGNGSTAVANTPALVTPTGALAGKTIRSLSPGYYTTCAIASDENAYCWGEGSVGQIGNSASADTPNPLAVTTNGALNTLNIKSITAGFNTICAIASDNNAYCWGQGTNGELGNGASANSNAPVAVSKPGSLAGATFESISVGFLPTGESTFCAVASNGNGYCWGYGLNGQLGNSASANSNVPVQVTNSGALASQSIKSITSGRGNSCAIAANDRAYCWGLGTSGQMGNATSTTSSFPVAVNTATVLAGKTITQISAAYSGYCVLTSENLPYCWGAGAGGIIGNGTTTGSTIPRAVTMTGVLLNKTVKAMQVGYYSVCVIASDDLPYCWGTNTNGTLGDGTTTSASVPVAVAPGALAGKTLKNLSAGPQHYCGVGSDDNLYCWGWGNQGMLGNGTTTNATAPSLVITPPLI